MKTLFLLLMLTTSLSAQDFDRSVLDAYFDSLALYDRAMGTLVIAREGETVYERSIGFADAGMTLPATPANIYRTGSISKTFTAVIILKLVDAGKMSLDDTLDKWYPEVTNADRITIDQLLRHQSGIGNYTAAEDVMEWIGRPHTPEEMVARIAALPADFEPGTDVAYSNSNFLLLGYIAERVTDMDYPTLLKGYITDPLQLRHTYYGGPIDSTKGEVVSFNSTGEGWRVARPWNTDVAGGAGALSSTATDLNTFYRALLRGELLKMETVEKMKEMKGGLGQGLFTFPFGDRIAYGHNGGIEGFSTLSGYFPDSDLSITYLSNGVDLPDNDIMIAALTIYHGLPFEMPDLTPVPDLPEEALQAYLGTYRKADFPLDIVIFVQDGKLFGQATGQGAFPLTPGAPDEFLFTAAGIRLLFVPGEGKMTLFQGGQAIEMKR